MKTALRGSVWLSIQNQLRWFSSVVILGCLVNSVLADTFGLFTYTDNGTTVTITGYPQTATGAVEIPASINGKLVTHIGSGAFKDCSSLTSVTIPDSVTHIGDNGGPGSFQRCTSLASVTIPEGVVSLEYSTFSSCTSLTNITIPNSVTYIGDAVFTGSGLTSVTIGNGVTSIGQWAFSCRDLTSVTIPDSVTEIKEEAFAWCTSLINVTIGSGVTTLAPRMFAECSSLEKVIIPNSITTIGNSAFFTCTSLASITIPEGVTSIGSMAFGTCFGLTSINIPNSVATIGNGAFYECTSLASVTLPSGLTEIAGGAFLGCSSLGSVFFEGQAPIMLDVNIFQDTPAGAQALVKPENAASFGGEGSTWYGLIVTLDSTPVEPIGIYHETEAGKAIIIDASALANSDPEATYQWYFDGVPSTPQAGGNESFFQIDGVAGNEGSWRVAVISNQGISEGSFEFRIFTDTDMDGLSDGYEEFVSLTNPNSIDSDGDTLGDFAEINTYLTNPNLADTDGDGFNDDFEIQTGFDPASATSTPDALSAIRTAVEFLFNAANGVSYRIEGSSDLNEWSTVETGIIGQGAVVTRFYSTANQPKLYFRARRN